MENVQKNKRKRTSNNKFIKSKKIKNSVNLPFEDSSFKGELPVLPFEIWDLITSFLSPIEKKLYEMVCKEWKENFTPTKFNNNVGQNHWETVKFEDLTMIDAAVYFIFTNN